MTFVKNNAPYLRLAAPRLLLTCSSSSACLGAEAQDGARPWLSSPFFFFVALACLDGSRDRAKHPQRSGQQCPLWLTQDLLGDNVHDNYGDENCER